jgi:hypothetical protein
VRIGDQTRPTGLIPIPHRSCGGPSGTRTRKPFRAEDFRFDTNVQEAARRRSFANLRCSNVQEGAGSENLAPSEAGSCGKLHDGPPERATVGQSIVEDRSADEGLSHRQCGLAPQTPREDAARTLADAVVTALLGGDVAAARTAALALVAFVEAVPGSAATSPSTGWPSPSCGCLPSGSGKTTSCP